MNEFTKFEKDLLLGWANNCRINIDTALSVIYEIGDEQAFIEYGKFKYPMPYSRDYDIVDKLLKYKEEGVVSVTPAGFNLGNNRGFRQFLFNFTSPSAISKFISSLNAI